MRLHKQLKKLTLSVFFLFIFQNTCVKAAEFYRTMFGVAIDGYDATSYFKAKTAMRGKRNYLFHWNGATWYFTNAYDRDSFAEFPEKFAPQYGGYCANEMSLGNKVKSDPTIWRIHKSKLYFFNSKKGREIWQFSIEKRIASADNYWQNFVQ